MELITCGAAEVIIFGWHHGRVGKPVWMWRAQEQSTIPAALQKRFGTTDDCKPVGAGKQILITSSGGAVALVERGTGGAFFAAAAPGAHSADRLPGSRIVVACAPVKNGGNSLMVFDLHQPDRPIFTEPFPAAHGVVWDAERNLLWAHGLKELRAYRLHTDNKGAFSLRRGPSFPLPTDGGHDMVPVPGTSLLVVTTQRSAYLFDRDRFTFAPHPFLGKMPMVKSVSIHPVSGQTVYVQAESPNWWAKTLHFRDPNAVYIDPKQRFYKARWG